MKKSKINVPFEKTLKFKFPEIENEWDYKHNEGLTPADFSYGSKEKVYWVCPICNQSYPMQICNRTGKRKSKCSVCRGLLIIPDVNSLKAQYPEIVEKEWDYNKNDIDPNTIAPHRNKPKYWWICQNGHSYDASVNNKTSGTGGNCPFCSSQRLSFEKSLASVNPELAKEWHPFMNGEQKPDNEFANSNNERWWKCSICGHDWKAKVNNRNQLRRGCPKCSKGSHTSVPEQLIYHYVKQLFPNAVNGYIFNKTEIDIFIPSLSTGIEYDGEKFHRTNEKYKIDIAKNELLWENGISLIRIRENGCFKMNSDKCIVYNCEFKSDYSYLQAIINKLLDYLKTQANIQKFIIVDINTILNTIQASIKKVPFNMSFAFLHKNAAEEWDYTLNDPLKPDMFFPMSDKIVGWICKKCGGKWNAPIKNRSKGYGCSRCAKRHQYSTEEWISKAIEVHGQKFDYSKVEYIDSKTKVKIKCLICKMVFEQAPSEHLQGKGCIYCSGQALHPLKTLAKVNPKIASEWDYEKNGTITPNDIGKTNIQKFWWRCDNGKNHSYLAYVQQRMKGSGCAVCAGRQVIPETSLATLFPDIAKEWDYEKNSPLTPSDVGKGYDGDIWWKCSNNDHPSYMAKVYNRTKKGTGCKKCYEEKRRKNAP